MVCSINPIGNESAPIQLAQCRFPGLAISNAKILVYFSNKNIRKQFYQTAFGNWFEITKMLVAVPEKILCHLL